MTDTQAHYWDKATRFLHIGLAVTVTLQLLNSLILVAPEPGEPPLTPFEAVLFDTHEWLGMAALLIVVLHWAWSLWGRGGAGMRHLFPVSAGDRAIMRQELRGLLALRLPPGGPQGRLAGLIHGLGLLAVSAAALSGAVLFFWMPENGALNAYTSAAEEVHEFISTFVWIYWGGHAGMAFLHHWFTRDDTLRNMFKLRA